MGKSARLFAILDSLRRARRPVTAEHLAGEHEVSVRTIYRDMATLTAMGTPIEGEAGLGFLLRPGFFLPPLTFTTDEIEALALGARWVENRDELGLSQAAASALGKIAAASPDRQRQDLAEPAIWPVAGRRAAAEPTVLATIREAMRAERTLHLDYADGSGAITQRAVWPAALAVFDDRQVVAAWCLLRQDFRSFRIDRVRTARIGEERFARRRAVLLADFRRRSGFTDAS